jgi:hypothetical protein
MRTNRIIVALAVIAVCTAGAQMSQAATIGVFGNVSHQPTPGGGAATKANGPNLVIDNSVNPFVRYQIAVRVSEGDNQGLSQVVYDVVSPAAKAKGYFFGTMQREASGYNNYNGPSMLQDISAQNYDVSDITVSPNVTYGGGWGYTNSGLPHGGNNGVNPGTILGAGDSLPLTWSGDLGPTVPGNQTFARIGIGQGNYAAPAEDPVIGGTTLGFGYDVANAAGTGDGSWVMHYGILDTTGWDKQTYVFVVTTTAGNVLKSGVDLTQPQGGGFREAVTGSDLIGTTFSFTLVPEPTCLSLLALGGLALIRRRG